MATCLDVPESDCRGVATAFVNNLAWSQHSVLEMSHGQVTVAPRSACPEWLPSWAEPGSCWQAVAVAPTRSGTGCMVIAAPAVSRSAGSTSARSEGTISPAEPCHSRPRTGPSASRWRRWRRLPQVHWRPARPWRRSSLNRRRSPTFSPPPVPTVVRRARLLGERGDRRARRRRTGQPDDRRRRLLVGDRLRVSVPGPGSHPQQARDLVPRQHVRHHGAVRDGDDDASRMAWASASSRPLGRCSSRTCRTTSHRVS